MAVDIYLGSKCSVGFWGHISGWTIKSMCGNPVPKYTPSIFWCHSFAEMYTSQHFGQYNFTMDTPDTSDNPTPKNGRFK